ncbi:hypothetical protein WA026_014895, partial [Henosepilachna vigintioctopunctata]
TWRSRKTITLEQKVEALGPYHCIQRSVQNRKFLKGWLNRNLRHSYNNIFIYEVIWSCASSKNPESENPERKSNYQRNVNNRDEKTSLRFRIKNKRTQKNC